MLQNKASSPKYTWDINGSPPFGKVLDNADVVRADRGSATSVTENTPGEHGLIGNLDFYIPVGVLKKHSPDNADATTSEPDNFPHSEVVLLENHHWIWTSTHVYQEDNRWSYLRIYILPDDVGRKVIPRSSTRLRRALKTVMARIDSSSAAWSGCFSLDIACDDQKIPTEDESLWYIFNTLQNPAPNAQAMRDPYTRKAMQHLLSVATRDSAFDSGEQNDIEACKPISEIMGLKTPLYPYQGRSAAAMVQREVQPAPMLDPRLQAYNTPTGQEYYYDKEEGTIVREKKMYSEARGGILAETMGCGKTLICLAVILATQGHFPQIPLEFQGMVNPVRMHTGSLVEMAAATAGRLSLPWKSYFRSLRHSGVFHNRCVKACENHGGAYTIPPPPARHRSRSNVAYPRPPPKHISLCSGTLIIVPPNLVGHWEDEIARHTEGLNIVVLRNSLDITPPPEQLLEYDIVLFSRARFEKEAGEASNNRRHSQKPEDSHLTKVHWLRVIVDEGHNVAGHGHRTNMVHMLDQLQVERRWIVSGTPSSGLYGVEVSLASQETVTTSDTDLAEATSAVLRGKKRTSALDNELNDLDKLRLIVVEFLDLKPWSNSRADDPANWTKYIKPVGDDGKRRKAQSLRATLQSLVVRHRMEVIHSEVPLPRLHNKVVRLEPTFYDKLNINLFIFILAVNAVTSERQDQDYMFHPRNRKHLSLLISNLRQAGFWWAGSEGDMQATVQVAVNYLDKNREKMSYADVAMLTEGISIADKAMRCDSWNAFKKFHELGVFILNFPSHAWDVWALDSSRSQHASLLLGLSQAHQAQKFVTSRLNATDPAEGLAGAGIKARRGLADRASRPDSGNTKKTIPDQPAKSPKKTFSKGLYKTLPSESSLSQTKLVATTSAKLTYLLDRVLEFHQAEKIIIFYDNNNSAFWIAEGLELIGVDFRIYASTLKPVIRAQYLELFRDSDDVRVLLMDLRQASHGLHIANASRVFIVNPIWQPNVESQAIKRAHRIGQTRPVFVETLVLRDTLEDRMLERRKTMSETEIQHAEKDLLDDNTMSTIIQNESFIHMPEDGDFIGAQLAHSPGFFDRHKLPIPDDYDSPLDQSPKTKRKPGPTDIDSSADTTTPDKRQKVCNLPQDTNGFPVQTTIRSPATSSPAPETKQVSIFG
ncbi:P-loop containing nucleoside triphosphate hydrolase protein [Aspergillus avenaceus]|uniref:P-loop containing nucleoside triphosphate hydrolase protein n=1 Tax=Aspergillus avenaceus TaxID=36643 RepID=A0A5N6TI52_ASPAV|nr:P-loop containing nucleoside triphosphate hydrolase protein [Aspergillus avenaceus]